MSGLRLCDPVGVEEEQVTRPEFLGFPLRLGVREQAERQAPAAPHVDLAVRTDHGRARVTRARQFHP